MLKKILVVSAVSLLTTGIAMASVAPYIGGGLGLVTNTSSSVPTGTVTSGSQTTILNQPANFRGVPFNVFLGYGGTIYNSFYLAGELDGTLGTVELSNNNKLKTSYGYGVSILPGIMLSDSTLAFLRVGVVDARFITPGKTVSGGQIGLGFQTNVTENIDVRGEYDYTAYNSFDTPANNSVNGQVSSPKTDAFNLGIIYKFE